MRLIFIFILAAFLGFSCSSNNNSSETTNSNRTDSTKTTSTKQQQDVFNAYLELKDAMVAGKTDEAKTKAGVVKKRLDDLDKGPDKPKDASWNDQAAKMRTELDKIASSSDIEQQRSAFSTLSDLMYDGIAKFGLAHEDVYHQFCPMAFDGKGAYWLNDKDEIRNPYFGDAMMNCGETKDTVKIK